MAIVSTELEVQDITTLPKRTASGIDPDTDFVLGVEENGIAYKADIEDLGQSIVQGAKSNLLGRNQTVASAFRMLREETNEKIKESYGAPLVANQASDMKDKTRVYVYTGHESGYHHYGWYYWNNVAWTLGGEYNAGIVTTDTTLSLADMPADAKAVGDALDEVNTELSSIADDVEQLQEDSSSYAASTSIAPVYSPSGIYAVGDYCMHDGALYRCTTAISTAEAWNASHWTADNVKNIADGLKDDVNDLKDDISNIRPGLSDDAKVALMACFEQVAWKNPNANVYLQALATALEIGIRIISGSDLGNYAMWYTAYPYYVSNNARLAYTKLDIPVTGGKIYIIKANTSQSNVNMRVDIYNENILAKAANEESISQLDHQLATGDWNALEQAIVMPKMINDSPTAGIVCIVRYSDDSNINVGAVDSIVIQEKSIGTVPSDYTEYDYIAVKGTSSVTTDATAVIMTTVYNDLGHAYISFDYLATSNLGTSNTPIIGVRGENDWAHTVCIYITSGKDYTVHSHGNKVISDAVTKNKINHIDLRQGSASPSIVVANGAKTEIAWTQDNTVYAPMYLFGNAVYNVTTSFSLSANVQLGQFVIWEADGEPDVYVPVVRNSDSVIGVYNVTRQEFHTCSDTTKAKVGHSNCLYQVGNW